MNTLNGMLPSGDWHVSDNMGAGARERETILAGRQIAAWSIVNLRFRELPPQRAKRFRRSLDNRTAHANKTAQLKQMKLAKAKKKKAARNLYTAADIKLLKQHSKARTPVSRISKEMKRTVGSLRQKAQKLGIGLGHQR